MGSPTAYRLDVGGDVAPYITHNIDHIIILAVNFAELATKTAGPVNHHSYRGESP